MPKDSNVDIIGKLKNKGKMDLTNSIINRNPLLNNPVEKCFER
jgi:hypothetical protein